ncbi:related to ribonuclease M [Melanopsichium pennsylvanicum]|uniref:ribonuclease T2 n=2 Tax=Melanopsichium pennsylvanicum TaxID=63383 RepID=A0AAJ4XL56_9BASI|nr:related to ribonuclease M [Melanopsichium pennsylvanicum 4]SNX84322.1 related to ribonuclease M [Melanopsichium pennsylvanicum]
MLPTLALATTAAIGLVNAATIPAQVSFTLGSNLNASSALDDACLSCATAPTCPRDPCSTNTPGGLLLLTQFWDYSPPIGPSDSWTIHGQWPDACSGGYESDCDPSRNNNNIAAVLRASHNPKAEKTLDIMNQYWLALNGNDGQLWSHEWNKHGTCVSTLAPQCYASSSETREYVQNEDIVDFFTTTTDLFEQYNIFQTLKNAGIVPDRNRRYTLAQLQEATREKWGKEATFKCRNGALNEAWIYFHTKGRSTNADSFVITDPLKSNNRCPAQGIRYLPK